MKNQCCITYDTCVFCTIYGDDILPLEASSRLAQWLDMHTQSTQKPLRKTFPEAATVILYLVDYIQLSVFYQIMLWGLKQHTKTSRERLFSLIFNLYFQWEKFFILHKLLPSRFATFDRSEKEDREKCFEAQNLWLLT